MDNFFDIIKIIHKLILKEITVIEFSEKIKYIRSYHNLTQDQLANKLNVSRKTISAWENNRGIPDYYLVKAIEQLFNIDSDSLLNPKKRNQF
ncbi:helix-turn-helix transcriptional regulator [Holzapfeliella floricola]|uniref:helix-turn-helix transcriptional regulator n=1 Tax=Holzapfeliella floricola TaxID=679249 RepID=UPI0007853AC0|nr:helix-turn-helix transcriptional regulator [Holzapfeliella floricola]